MGKLVCPCRSRANDANTGKTLRSYPCHPSNAQVEGSRPLITYTVFLPPRVLRQPPAYPLHPTFRRGPIRLRLRIDVTLIIYVIDQAKPLARTHLPHDRDLRREKL